MPYPWELTKPDYGSKLAEPDRNLSNQALDEGEWRSVYFLLNLGGSGKGPGHALFKVTIDGGKILGRIGELLNPVSKLFDRSDPDVPAEYLLAAARLNSATKLYLFQHVGYRNWWLKEHSFKSYQACIFDIITKELKPFKPPEQNKRDALFISAYGKLYHLAHPSAITSNGMPDPAFEVYDPNTDQWNRCSAFPCYNEDWFSIKITGYAICYGCILVSMQRLEDCDQSPGKYKMWVYQVTSDQWKEVNVPSDDNSDSYYPFHGKAVVIDSTVYALTGSSEPVIIAFCLMLKQMVDGSVEYSVDKPRPLHGLRTCFHMDSDCRHGTECLVHLGGFNFCLLQTIMKYYDRQRVWITTFDIIYKEGKKRIRTLDTTMRQVDIVNLGQFKLESGFTLECEEGKEIVSTKSMTHPTDDYRLCKLQQAACKKIRKQKQKRRWRTLKLSSRKLNLLGNMFRPCREPKIFFAINFIKVSDLVHKLTSHPYNINYLEYMWCFQRIFLADERGYLEAKLKLLLQGAKFHEYQSWIDTIQASNAEHLKEALPVDLGQRKGKYKNEDLETLVTLLRNIFEPKHGETENLTNVIAKYHKEVCREVQELFSGFLALLIEEVNVHSKYYEIFEFKLV